MSNVKMKGFRELVNIDEASKIFFEKLPARELEKETVKLENALNRVLAVDISAEVDVPQYDRSAVDGYAVVAEDTFGCSQTNPAVLKVVGKISIGEYKEVAVGRGKTVFVATGAHMPKGADAVVMVEYTKKISNEEIEIQSPVTPQKNVSKAGEDVKRGEKVLGAGMLLKPQDLGILGSLGLTKVSVYRKPIVGVLSTGSELIELGGQTKIRATVDVNRLIISGMVRKLGGMPVDLGIARDRLDEVRSRIAGGLAVADAVIVSGGTSVGEADLVPDAINSLGKPGMVVHGVSMRPAMPTGLAVVNGKPIFSLSGYPVAAMVGFNVFVKPYISRLLKGAVEPQPKVRARITRRVASEVGVRSFVRVIVRKVEKGYIAEPIRTSGAGVLSTMVKANGVLAIPEGKEGVEAGEEVEVTLLRSVEDEED